MSCVRSLVIFMLLLNHYYCSVAEDMVQRISAWISPNSLHSHAL